MDIAGLIQIDLNNIFGFIKELIFKAILFPFKLWNMIPLPIRISIGVILFVLSVALIISAYKNRNEWLHVRY